jgi:hypothetical protein
MSAYLTQIQAEAHAADLTEQARQAQLVRLARTGQPRPRRLRTSTARFLVALAVRLDHGLQPPAVPATASCHGT